ncbi:unnamed protein product, partial [marine sediment metagenome]
PILANFSINFSVESDVINLVFIIRLLDAIKKSAILSFYSFKI